MSKIKNISNNNPSEYLYGEIDLKDILSTILREKKIILFTTFTSGLLAFFYLLNARPIWNGSFEILIQEEVANKSGEINPLIGKFTGSLGQNSNETLKKILKSPLVLKPVYEYVQNYSSENNLSTKNNFESWSEKHLNIDFTESSSVLKINYLSSDKNLILNALNLISNEYQDYSKQEKEYRLNKTISYLINQKKIMKIKSSKSQEAFNDFSIKNGLGNLDGIVNLDKTNTIKSLGNISFKSSSTQRFKSQFLALEELEAEYIRLSSAYKPESKEMKFLKRKIETLRNSLKKPSEILLKFNDLSAAKERDEVLLSKVSEELEILKLEKLNSPDPWKIISEPTLDEDKIFPKESSTLLIFIFVGILISLLIAILKEKVSDKIFTKNGINSLIKCDLIETIYNHEADLSIEIINKITKNDQEVGLINYSNLDNNFLNKLLKQNLNLVGEDINNLKDFNKIILLIEKGFITSKELKIINKYIFLHPEKFLGWIFIDNL